MWVRRAAPGGLFGAAQRAGRVPRGWASIDYAISSTATELLLAWQEFTDQCGVEFCFDRVVAAVAPAGSGFGPAEVLSPVGSQLGDDPIVPALSEQGRRLVAWLTADTDGSAPPSLWVALGDRAADVRPSRDSRAPRVTARVSRRALRMAVRNGRLRVRFRSDEACAVHFEFRDRPSDTEIARLRIVVLRRAGATIAEWRLRGRDRRVLRRSLERGRPILAGMAADSAGNLRGISVPLPRDVPFGRASGA